MASITFPTLSEIVERQQNDFKTELPNSNPFLPDSWMRALIISNSGRYFENYITLNQVLLSFYPTTATDEFIQLWQQVFNLPVIAATQSSGTVVATGTVGGSFAAGDLLQTSDATQYEVTSNSIIATNTFSTTLVRSGSVVTATTASDHSFASGIQVTIAGADQTEYNGTFEILVTSSTTFTYTITGTPVTPATGVITSSADLAQIPIESVDFGVDTNLDSGTELTFLAVSAADGNVAYVNLSGLTGGTDAQTNDEVRSQVLNRFQNPVANFNISAIENQAFLVANVKQVDVNPTTPAAGSVTVYFTVSNTGTGIPTAAQVTAVKNSILLIKPAELDDANVIVDAPTPIFVDFTFIALVPNTATMQAAVLANLQQFFSEQVLIGEPIEQVAYQSAIFNTIDPETGNQVTSFTLSAPIGDIAIASDEIGVLNNVVFP